jgi:hypothetical protein
MITMEFDEMKKIWDSQNNELIFGVNEKALHNRILSKKKQAHHITNISELLWIIVNIGAGCLVFGMSFFKQSENIFMYLLSVWMVGSALYTLISRIRRIKGNKHFERSIHGDLEHAISVATYQVRFSQLGRWNILPIGILIILGVWSGGNSIWLALSILIFLILTNYAAGWEHNFYKGRKRELEILKNKLENENPPERLTEISSGTH